MIRRIAYFFLMSLLASSVPGLAASPVVVAFWGFSEDYDFFTTNPNALDFAADIDATLTSDANLQAYLGVADELDDNGGGGIAYTSSVSGVAYEPTRSLKWDDLKGGGDDFSIGGVDTFQVDKQYGNGPTEDDFGNDALVYLTLNGAGYSEFGVRFDIEGTPGDLPDSFDVFYRTGGVGSTWFRDPDQNNIGLSFMDYDPIDPENQFAGSGLIALSSALDNAESIEIILGDFAENGNNEMEIDNVEIVATAIPEPAGAWTLLTGATLFLARRRS